MNKAYRLIWNSAKEAWVVVAETVKSCGTIPAITIGSAALMAAVLCGAVPASALDPTALPTGGQIVAGSGSIATTGSAMTVTQTTQRMVANWNSFNIGQNASVAFNQPTASSLALNRITDQNPSQIMGSLSANGQIFLLNPSGIIFGQTAQVNVGALVASSLNLTTDNFMAGKLAFEKVGAAGAIINQGSIRTADGGYVAFLAPQVKNEGSITANQGSVLLAAADKVNLDFTGDGLLSYSVEQGAVDALAENKGLIKADGGLVVMTAQAADSLTQAVVNNEGAIEAQTIANKGGKILLLADMDNGLTTVSGTLDASAPNGGDGGFVETSAHSLNIAAGAVVKAGNWLIDPANVTISTDPSSGMTLFAPSSGFWSSTLNVNTLTGALNAGTNTTVTTYNSGSQGGSAGDITVASAISWTGASRLTLRADNNIYINENITASNAGGQLALYYGQSAVAAGNTSIYSIASGKSISLQEGNNFFTKQGSDGVEKTYYVITGLGAAGSTTGTDLQGINGGLTGNYALGADIDASGTSTWNDIGGGVYAGFQPIGTYTTRFTGTFDGLGHTVSGLVINTNTAIGTGLFGATNGATLQNVSLTGLNIKGHQYVGGLVGDANATIINNVSVAGTLANYSGIWGNYFGGIAGAFTDGAITNAHAGVTISHDDGYPVAIAGGLVGYLVAGSSDVTISDSTATGSITANSGMSNYIAVGGLVGAVVTDGHTVTIKDSSSSMAVTATGAYGGIGGLVGEHHNNAATGSLVIDHSSSSGTVTATMFGYGDYGAGGVGGLVGSNYGQTLTIKNNSSSSSVMNVTIGDASYGGNSVYGVGGLVGGNFGGTLNISNSSSSNALTVTVNNDSYVRGIGGLVGYNGSYGSSDGVLNVTGSTSSKAITVTTNDYSTAEGVGGLVGYNDNSNSSISGSNASGAVTVVADGNSDNGDYGIFSVGGLVGYTNGGTITNSSASGAITATASGYKSNIENVGGLVGKFENGALTDNDSVSTGTITLTASGERSGIYYVGGLVGMTEEADLTGLTPATTSAISAVASGDYSEIRVIGGLVGYMHYGGTISGSSSARPISVEASGYGSNIGRVGGLVGSTYYGYGAITNSSASGAVTATASGSYSEVYQIGGLVGRNGASEITNSSATGAVTVIASGSYSQASEIGGLVGYNDNKTITGSSATGAVSVTVSGLDASAYGIGGLVGHNEDGTITNSTTSTGGLTVEASGSASWIYDVGGLVGFNDYGTISGSSSSRAITAISSFNAAGPGEVSKVERVGGLVGDNGYGSTVETSSATGAMTLTASGIGSMINTVGGLIGVNSADLTGLTQSTTDAITVTASGGYSSISNIGGLVGFGDFGTISSSSAARSITITVGSGSYGVKYVGGLVGYLSDQAAISNGSATGAVSVTDNSSIYGVSNVGGLVGRNDGGTITYSHATGAVATSAYNAGGLVGDNNGGTIENSYATGVVTASTNNAGGLVGQDYGGSIENSYATGAVSATSNNAGGLVGNALNSHIESSYATGNVSGGTSVGGLVGSMSDSVTTVLNSFASGSVTGTDKVGGLIGNLFSSTVTNSLAVGAVSGTTNVGGLIGYAGGTNTITASFWDTTTTGQASSAGGTGKTTAELQNLSTFSGWNMAENTGIDTGYPLLTMGGATVWQIHSTPLSANIYLRLLTGSSIYGDTPTFTYGFYTAASGGTEVTDANPSGTAVWNNPLSAASAAGTYGEIYQSGITLGNSGYTLNAGSSINWIINPRPVNLAVTKTYNGTTAFDSGFVLTGMVNGDSAPTVSGNARVTNKNVATYNSFASSTLTLNNSNYTLTGGTVAADITAKALTVSGTTVANKVYDGTVAASLNNGALQGVVAGDAVTLTQSGAFSDKNVGTGKTVTATDSINGTDSGNYTLTQPTGLTADITAKALTVSGTTVANKVYDGTVAAALSNGTLQGIVTGDAVTLTQSGEFSDKNVGTGKTVTATDSISGTDSGNYTLTQPTGLTADITAKAQEQQLQQIIASITSHQQHQNGTQGDDGNGGGQNGNGGSPGPYLGAGAGSGLLEGSDMGGLITDRTGYRTNE